MIGQYGIRTNFECEDSCEPKHFIFQPLSSMVEVPTGISVLTSKKSPPDRPADDVDVGCFSGTDLRIAWLWHESTSLLLYIKLLTVNIRIFRARCNHSSSILFWVS